MDWGDLMQQDTEVLDGKPQLFALARHSANA
jgi:hypothetical protein